MDAKKRNYIAILTINKLQYNDEKNVSIPLGMMLGNVKRTIKNCFYDRTIRANLISNEDHRAEIRKEKTFTTCSIRGIMRNLIITRSVSPRQSNVFLSGTSRATYHEHRSQTTNVDYLRDDDDAPILSLFSQWVLPSPPLPFPHPTSLPPPRFKFYDRECNRCANRWSDNSQLRMHDRQSAKENRLYRSRIIGYHYNSALTRSRSRAAFIKKY